MEISHFRKDEQFVHIVQGWKGNEKFVIIYLPSCRSEPIRVSLIFERQMKILLMKREGFLSLDWKSVTPKLWCLKNTLYM